MESQMRSKNDINVPESNDRWYLGALNDGLFIINLPPSPCGTDIPPDWGTPPSLVLNVTDLPQEKAQAIVDAHNASINAEQINGDRSRRDMATITGTEKLPKGYGVACTIAWTELVQALRADGHAVNDSSGPTVRKWIQDIVRDTFKAQESSVQSAEKSQDEGSLDLKEIELSAWPPDPGGMRVYDPRGVKLVHKPSGITVICNHERSQHRNREAALAGLEAALKAATGCN